MKRIAASILAILWAAALAGEGQSAAPLRDPWVPPGVREQAQSPQAAELQGPALRAQVERKLRASFAAADTEHRGSITLEQAHTAHLGFVEENFTAMDETHSGRVTFDDVARFLHARGARTF
jgi:hypothetical protein